MIYRLYGIAETGAQEVSYHWHKRLKAAEGKTRVLKPEAGTNPHVFYIGLDDQLSGRVDGVSAADMMWRPGHQGG